MPTPRRLEETLEKSPTVPPLLQVCGNSLTSTVLSLMSVRSRSWTSMERVRGAATESGSRDAAMM